MISTVLFDFDGVIINSNPAIIAAWKTVALEYGIEISDHDVERYILGVTSDYTLSTLFAQFDRNTQKEIHHKVSCLEEAVVYDLLDGFKPFYQSLLATPIKLGVVTGSWRRKLVNVFHQHSLAGFFCVVTRDDSQFSKPDPFPYLKAINFWHEKPENVLVFEDSSNGIKSALAAGTNCIAIDNLSINGVSSIKNFTEIAIKNQQICIADRTFDIVGA